MDESEDDPWTWDTSKLAHELCSNTRLWDQNGPSAIPNLEALSAALMAHNLDGRILLTWEDRSLSLPEMCNKLRIENLSHQSSFVDTIPMLKSISPAYRRWRSNRALLSSRLLSLEPNEAFSSLYLDSPVSDRNPRRAQTPTGVLSRVASPSMVAIPTSPNHRKRSAPEDLEGAPMSNTEGMNKRRLIPQNTRTASRGLHPFEKPPFADLHTSDWVEPKALHPSEKSPMSSVELCTEPQRTNPLETAPISNLQYCAEPQRTPPLERAPMSDTEGMKKRRLIPQNIWAEPQRTHPFEIPTEADVLKLFRPVVLEDSTLHGAYLSRDPITSRDISGPRPQAHLMETKNPASFWSFPNIRPPPGQVLKVHRVVKRKLIKTGAVLAHPENGRGSVLTDSSLRPSEGDSDLPLFGDSEDDYDSETYAEIQEEQAEREREQRERELNEIAHRARLTDDEVGVAIDKAVSAFESSWADSKLPRAQNKANSMWHDVRRRNELSLMSNTTKERVRRLEHRLTMLRRQILGQAWSSEDAVLKQAHSMEGSVHDLSYQKWFFGMISQPKEPPKSATIPAARPKVKRLPLPEDDIDGDEEVITDEEETEEHDEEEENDGFIAHSPKRLESLLPGPAAPGDPNVRNALAINRLTHSLDSYSVKSEGSGVVDLTMVDDDSASDKDTKMPTPEIIDLLTPEKVHSAHFSADEFATGPLDGASAAAARSEELTYGQLTDIAKQGYGHWEDQGDVETLLINALYRLKPGVRMEVFAGFAKFSNPHDLWQESISSALQWSDDEGSSPASQYQEVSLVVAYLFLDFIKCRHQRLKRRNAALSATRKREILGSRNRFRDFCLLLSKIISRFPKETLLNTWDSAESDGDALPGGPNDTAAPSGAPVKKHIGNKAAADMRKRDKERQEEQAKRRDILLQKLESSLVVPSDKSRLIINMSKDDDQGFINVNKHIAGRIKDHQIEGVRFMWNQITEDAENRQGCLLAHTMGLGKTMQIITLLVAIAEAAQSPDRSIASQIPSDLAKSKTLVLCPTGLVDNWMDELLMWDPLNLLGRFNRVVAVMGSLERQETVEGWRDDGGVLVVGYDLFRRLVKEAPDISNMLLEVPSLVVADEAHLLKNTNAELRRVSSRFRTHSRIAMTGSPLANHVGEYWTMIDWVAPNYLGPYTEFDQTYQKPIENGLWGNSTQEQKRAALKTLLALTKVVGPKMHRATMRSTAREADMPHKTELLITVPLTDVQKRLYNCYVAWAEAAASKRSSMVFAVRNNLILICNHPKAYNQRCEIANGKRLSASYVNEEDKSLDGQPLIEGLKLAKVVRDLDDASLSWKTHLLLRIVERCKVLEDRVLVFSHSLLTLDYLEALFRMHQVRVCRLDGSTPVPERQAHVKLFNQGDQYDVFLISSLAGSVGFNITGANRVVLFDSKYNPVHEQQAVGRAYRMGQEKPVYVYRFMCGGTDEESLHNQSVYKIQLSARVVDKSRPMPRSTKRGQYKEVFSRAKESVQKPLDKFRGIDSVMDSVLDDAELVRGIRSILEMDTFEEQELESLTEADKLEADNMAELSRLRRLDPEAYKKAMAAMAAASQTPATGPPPSYPAMNDPLPSTAWLPWANGMPPMVPAPRVLGPSGPAPPLAPLRMIPVLPSSSSSSGVQVPSAGPTAVTGGVRNAEPSGIHKPAANNNTDIPPHVVAVGPKKDLYQPQPQAGKSLLPISGANTGFRRQDEAPQAAPVPVPAHPTANGLVSKADFECRLLARLVELGASQVGDAAALARRVADNVEQERKQSDLGELANNHRWRLLRALLAGTGFVMAVSTGNLTPERLARAKDSELRREADIFENSTRVDVDRRMGRANTPTPNTNTAGGAGAPARMWPSLSMDKAIGAAPSNNSNDDRPRVGATHNYNKPTLLNQHQTQNQTQKQKQIQKTPEGF